MNRMSYYWILIFGIVFLCAMSERAMARPPTAINLSYDLEKRNLHIEAEHVTKNPRKHFIRQIIVYKNDVRVEKRFYVQQTSASMLTEDFALEAASTDALRVEVVCNEAGRKEATLVIP